jgi:hypothetical protein
MTVISLSDGRSGVDEAPTKLDGPPARGRKGYRKVFLVAVIAFFTSVPIRRNGSSGPTSYYW